MSTHPPKRRLRLAATLTAAATFAAVLTPASLASAASQTVTVNFAQSTGAVRGGATGMLYGLSDPGVPSQAVVAGVRPRTITQMPEGGLQHPNGGAVTVSGTYFAAGGTDIYVNIQDEYPKWGYANAADPANTYPGQADYLAKLSTVVQKIKDSVPAAQLSRFVFTPFNEPDWIWYGDWNTRKAQFFADWSAAFTRIRQIIPNARIAGIGESQYNSGRIQDFLTYAKANNQLPQVFTWHELDNSDLADFRGHLSNYRAIEDTLGIADIPVNITEYAWRQDMGVPGRMIQWISMFESAKVDAQVAYWSYAGNLNDHAVQSNGGNGGWWAMKWYRDLTGNTVALTPPQLNAPGTLQGVAAVDTTKRIGTVIVGGGVNDIALQLNGLSSSTFGTSVDVRVSRASFSGQEGFASSPPVVLAQRINLSGGSGTITIPNTNAQNAYKVTIQPAGASVPTTNAPWSQVTEAESATLAGGAFAYTQSGDFSASGGADVGSLGSAAAQVTWSVTVPRNGTYALDVLYGTGERPTATDPSLKSGRHALYVDGALNQTVQYTSTLGYIYRGSTRAQIPLTAGTHSLSIRTSSDGGATALPGSNLALDRFDLTELAGSETSTYPAIEARTTGAVTVNPSVGAYGGRLTLPSGASAELFLAAAQSGYYNLRVDYATPGGTAAIGASLNGRSLAGLTSSGTGQRSSTVTVHLAKGIQQLVLSGPAGMTLDGVTLTRNTGADSNITTIQAEGSGVVRSTGVTVETPAAAYGSNVSGQFAGWLTAGRTLTVARPASTPAGQYNVMVSYANADKFTGHPYNTDVLTRTARITETGGSGQATGQFRHNYSYYSFWWQAVPIDLSTSSGSLVFSNPTGDAPNVDAFQIARLVTGVSNTAR